MTLERPFKSKKKVFNPKPKKISFVKVVKCVQVAKT